MSQQFFTGVRQAYRFADSPKQPHLTQRCFQCFDLATNGGLREAKPRRRRTKASRVRHRNKRLKLFRIKHTRENAKKHTHPNMPAAVMIAKLCSLLQ